MQNRAERLVVFVPPGIPPYVEELRRVWGSAAPHAGSAMLLQQAWVADGCPR